MRRFIVLAHEATTSPEFSLNDLCGNAGRMDVLCRAIGAAFFLSHDFRRDVEMTLLVQGRIQIRLVGEALRQLNPDERSTAALLKRALESPGEDETEATPGIYGRAATLPSILDRLYQVGAHPLVLHEDGEPFDARALPADPAFFLSDHLPFSADDDAALAHLPRLSLGRRSLHTSQCVTIVHFLLDRAEDEADQGDLVLCHKVWGEPKAVLIKGLLEDFDIPVNLLSHVPSSVFPVALDGLSEVRIMVRERDLRRAREIITDYFEAIVEE